MYKSLEKIKPKEKQIVLAGICENPMFPILAIYKKGKFYNIDDNIELFPTYWKELS